MHRVQQCLLNVQFPKICLIWYKTEHWCWAFGVGFIGLPPTALVGIIGMGSRIVSPLCIASKNISSACQFRVHNLIYEERTNFIMKHFKVYIFISVFWEGIKFFWLQFKTKKAQILNLFALKLFNTKYFVPILRNFVNYWKKSRDFFTKLTFHRPSEMVAQSNFTDEQLTIINVLQSCGSSSRGENKWSFLHMWTLFLP